MQETAAGGGELSRASGLARFCSAPANWFDSLLENDDSLKLTGPQHPQGGLTHLLSAGTGPSVRPTSPYIQPTTADDPGFFNGGGGGVPATNSAAFHRMNSSPAEFLSANIDGYFSSIEVPSSYDFFAGVSPSGKRLRQDDSEHHFTSFPPQQGGEQGEQLNRASSLVEMEMKLLEDSVLCRVRAKRGCATHPRSIAERVRRTRISDRIRKLQELVPDMDKQTNTADMLEEAVEYVKTLQRQIQELKEQQKKCKCMAKS